MLTMFLGCYSHFVNNKIDVKVFKMKIFTGVAGVAVAASMIFSQAAVADGATLFNAKGCAGCHGKAAMGAVGPRLAGQQEKYLVGQFKLIRDGKRTSGMSGVMAGAVKSVTDADIAEIAKHLSSME